MSCQKSKFFDLIFREIVRPPATHIPASPCWHYFSPSSRISSRSSLQNQRSVANSPKKAIPLERLFSFFNYKLFKSPKKTSKIVWSECELILLTIINYIHKYIAQQEKFKILYFVPILVLDSNTDKTLLHVYFDFGKAHIVCTWGKFQSNVPRPLSINRRSICSCFCLYFQPLLNFLTRNSNKW